MHKPYPCPPGMTLEAEPEGASTRWKASAEADETRCRDTGRGGLGSCAPGLEGGSLEEGAGSIWGLSSS